jgi:membrane protein implicated in regulation of membrane protease activity
VSASAATAPVEAGGLLARVDELLGRRVSLRSLALLRVLVGPIVILHLWPFLSDSLHGRTYQDVFHEPYASWYPELPESVYIGLLWVGAGAAVTMPVAALARLTTLTRVAGATTFAVVAYNLFLSTTHFHNNRAYLVIVLGLLAVAPAAEAGPGWPLWLLRFECAAIYGASGLSKLLDPDWFGGTVTWQRVVQQRDQLRPLPDWVVNVLTDRGFHTGAAKLIVCTELFIALGLWSRRTRYAAVWVAAVFHVMIEGSASVQVFSFLGVAVLLVWAVPSTRDRVLRVDTADAGQRRLASVVRRLDWLARFRVETVADRSPAEVVDRDGAVRRGPAATIFALSRLPLTAWFFLPALLLPSIRRTRS